MSRINIWIVLLLISVLANGVLIGAGARSGFGEASVTPQESREVRRGGFQLRAFVQALPPEQRRIARARAEESRRELSRLVRDVAETRRAAAEALVADPFDQAAAAAALEQSREARAALEQATEIRILELAAELDPEVRRAAFRAAMTLPERGGPPPMGRRPGPPPRGDRPGPPPGG